MSAFWERKMRTYFQRFDYNQDGVLTAKDFQEIADYYSDMAKSDHANKQNMRELLQKIFETISHGVGGEEAEDFELTELTFIHHFKKQLTDPKSLERVKTVFKEAGLLGFTMLDLNGYGLIEPDGYATVFRNIKIDPKMAEDSFKAIDTDHDGHISKEEYATAFVKFMTSDDETDPTRLYLGPLVPE